MKRNRDWQPTEKKGYAGEKPNNVDIHSEYEIRKIENREKTNARPMEKFLDSLSKGKKKSYRGGRGLDAFFEATRPKKDPIDEAEARRYPNLRENPEATKILNEEMEKTYSPRPRKQ